MTPDTLEKLKYPIGTFRKPEQIDESHLNAWIESISSFPQRVKVLTDGLTTEQLNWRYRPEGWSIKQVVHHCGDSHMNSIIRFKLALTEDNPSIKPYFEDRWAKLIDSNDDDISHSIMLLMGLHYRWVILLRSLGKKELERTFYHPENRKESNLAETIGQYAWHCEHHLAHIKQAVEHQGSF
ncbi:bacillithiol transferase BstA [Echinicola sediminis]